jgi:hypothetical protein
MDVLRQASDEKLLAANYKLVGNYVKDVLFEKTVFLLASVRLTMLRKSVCGFLEPRTLRVPYAVGLR